MEPQSSQFRANLAMSLTPTGGVPMRTFVLGVFVAGGLIAAPAGAQQTLPRPSQLPPPAAQKAPPPQSQKGAPPQQQAQQPPMAPPAPYTALTVSPPKPYTDPALAAFRKELAAIAQKKARPALARLVLPQGFFWLKEQGNAVGKKT